MPIDSEMGLEKVTFLVGNIDTVRDMEHLPAKVPFSDDVCIFLNKLSAIINSKNKGRLPDLATLAFWIRRSSLKQMKLRFENAEGRYRLGKGIAFHISPSNVPVNFAYSMIAGLLTGNANIVRVPSKDFDQINVITMSIEEALKECEEMRPYIALVRYERDRSINDYFSSVADLRVVWGGDNTISELRKSPLKSRATEVVFADRYSISVIDSDAYIESDDPKRIVNGFYNDTYLVDQNACTSPFLVVWIGSRKTEAKGSFWNLLYGLVSAKYMFQDIQGINKLTKEYLIAAQKNGISIIDGKDNLIARVKVDRLDSDLFQYKENSGLFFEYDCDDMIDLKQICNNSKCQTVGYFGDKKMFSELLELGLRGIDRIVPIGETMDFDLIWDGYNLFEQFTRIIDIR